MYKGDVVSIVCNSVTKVKWQGPKGWKRHKNVNTPHNTLIIQNVKRKQSGIYYCIGTTLDNKDFKAMSELLVAGIFLFLLAVQQE